MLLPSVVLQLQEADEEENLYVLKSSKPVSPQSFQQMQRRLDLRCLEKNTMVVLIYLQAFLRGSEPLPGVFTHLLRWGFLRRGWRVCSRLTLEAEEDTVRG